MTARSEHPQEGSDFGEVTGQACQAHLEALRLQSAEVSLTWVAALEGDVLALTYNPSVWSAPQAARCLADTVRASLGQTGSEAVHGRTSAAAGWPQAAALREELDIASYRVETPDQGLLVAAVALLAACFERQESVTLEVCDEEAVRTVRCTSTGRVADLLGHIHDTLLHSTPSDASEAVRDAPPVSARIEGHNLAGPLAGLGLPLSFVGTERSTPQLWTWGGQAQLSLHPVTGQLGAAGSSLFFQQLERLMHWLRGNPEAQLAQAPLLDAADLEKVAAWNDTRVSYDQSVLIHQLIEAQVKSTPDAKAVTDAHRQLTYRELNRRADLWAAELQGRGVRPNTCVGLCLERSVDLLVALLATLKAGAAYVPLDPAFPLERLHYMLGHSETRLVIGNRRHLERLTLRDVTGLPFDSPADDPTPADAVVPPGTGPHDLAYVMYTSGSTGLPKGVMVEHHNVTNFFQAMDAQLAPKQPGRWLAVTSLSFDISVLELLWTLARGFEIILYDDADAAPPAGQKGSRVPEFSLAFFASERADPGPDPYQLLRDAAQFADTHDFRAVWIPERHFHAFGGAYPNPVVAAAALATVTQRIQLRAGSIVLPLHHPVRVAEDWAMVDQLSHGRVGLAFASGWQANDFLLAPENYHGRRDLLWQNVEVVQRLWRGEAQTFGNGLGEPVAAVTRPRPVQAELPTWVTAAGNIDTFRRAGEMGASLLTHLLGQSLAELAEKIAAYREAYASSGRPGRGHVTLMLHTFLGETEDLVRAQVRPALKQYLASSVNLVRDAAWSFPAFSSAGPRDDIDLGTLSAEELDALLEHAFERYYESSGLFGTPQSAARQLQRVTAADVDEVACLIDFGLADAQVTAALGHLDTLRRQHLQDASPRSLGDWIERYHVTHLQCTPSRARMLLTEPAALRGVQYCVLGGEPLPPTLAEELRVPLAEGGGQLINMYGPTETTVWSLAFPVDAPHRRMPIGWPLANTEVFVTGAGGELQPLGCPGELRIGGQGVTRGYLKSSELTAQRFQPHPSRAGERVYCTGDLVQQRADGALLFLGRNDHQVKVRGYRVELEEVEAALVQVLPVRQGVVVVRERHGSAELHAYVVTAPGTRLSESEWRRGLSLRLPSYMVPSRLIEVEALPLTPNGKVDRRVVSGWSEERPAREGEGGPAAPGPLNATGVPEGAGQAASPTLESPPPPTDRADLPWAGRSLEDIEAEVEQLWQLLLGKTGLARDVNFFDSGGHSLLAVSLVTRLRETFGLPLKLTDVFRFPTIASMAAHLHQGAGSPAQSQGSRPARRDALARQRQRGAADRRSSG